MEQTYSLGALFSKPDVRDYKIACALDESQFPEDFELKLPIVKSQGSVGSCVAHSISEVVEYHHKLETNQTQQFSTGYIYGRRTDYTGSGMYTRDAIKNVTKYGDVKNELFDVNVEVPKAISEFENRDISIDEQAYPYRFSSYFKCNSILEIKSALMNYGPVVFAMEWFDDIKVNKQTGLISTNAIHDSKNGGHCMVICGWCPYGWIIQNSWGSSWGKKGIAILPYDIPIREAWGISDSISEGDIIKPYNSRLGKLVSKVLNLLLRVGQFIKNIFIK